jgi:hypothetical protein
MQEIAFTSKIFSLENKKFSGGGACLINPLLGIKTSLSQHNFSCNAILDTESCYLKSSHIEIRTWPALYLAEQCTVLKIHLQLSFETFFESFFVIIFLTIYIEEI